MRFRGARVKVKFDSSRIWWKPVNPVGCCVSRRSLTKQVPLDEVLSALALPKPTDVCCCPREHQFVVYSCRRKGPRDPNTWRLEEHVLAANSPEQVKEWVGLINDRLQLFIHRPRNLLVFINPYAGTRLARITWEREVRPVFQRARIRFNEVETNKQDHARDMLELMKAEELDSYQGVVAVGGDGLFQEVVSGLLARRARGDPAAYRMRVGHVPAGSTDAVACTLHGSRCPTTAALHIALGDRLSLDSGRVQAADGSVRHFVCQAGYGFMGDVMRFSEHLRFMGPGRYDVTGALQYLRLASYRVSLSYREAASTTADVQQLCTAQCEVCRMAGINMNHNHISQHQTISYSSSVSALPAAAASAAAASAAAAASVGAPGVIGMVVTGNGSSSHSGGGGGGGLAPAAAPAVASPSRSQLPVSTGALASGSGGTAGAGSGAPAVDAAQALPSSPGAAPAGGAAAGGNWFSGAFGGGGGYFAGAPYSIGGEGSAHSSSATMPLYGAGRPPSAPVSQASASGLASSAAAAAALPYEPPTLPLDRVSNALSSVGPADVGAGKGQAGAATAPPTPSGAAGPGVGQAGSRGVLGVPGSAASASDAAGWKHVEGEFVSIMCVVTPCRSDKSKRGIIPNGHLSDGRMYLVLVEKCSHVSFLRFLLRLSTRGLSDLCLPFVRVIPITALNLSPLPGGHRLGGCLWDASSPESAWNVDGELLANNNVSITVTRGALEVFARGPETTTIAAQMGARGSSA